LENIFVLNKRDSFNLLYDNYTSALREKQKKQLFYKVKLLVTKEISLFFGKKLFCLKRSTFSQLKVNYDCIIEQSITLNNNLRLGLKSLENYFKFFMKRALLEINSYSEFSSTIKENKHLEEEDQKIKRNLTGALSILMFVKNLVVKKEKLFFKKICFRYRSLKKRIDHFIVLNVSEVNLSIEKEINKKTKMLKYLCLIQKMMRIRQKHAISNRYSSLSNYFFVWRRVYVTEISQILLMNQIEEINEMNVYLNKEIDQSIRSY